MPQFPQQWRSRPGAERRPDAGPRDGAAAEASAEPAAALMFEPEVVARAIVFHILDEGLAREVAADSVRRTVGRLRRRALRPVIRRSAWELMTNHQRLEWLLSETHTIPLVNPDDDTVSLEARDAG